MTRPTARDAAKQRADQRKSIKQKRGRDQGLGIILGKAANGAKERRMQRDKDGEAAEYQSMKEDEKNKRTKD